ncbi:MAG: DUF4240 domain-containing protein [Oscillospiraceae bacterium]|nr:DUF4240 domain-containing protein [Oscillospiraceae bacterium]
MADKKRTIQGGYEVIHAIQFGGSELIFSENKNSPDAPYMVSDCVWNRAFCYESHHNAMGGTDFVEIMKLFAHRLSERVVAIENERETRGIPLQTLTAKDCQSIKNTNLEGRVVVIKPEHLAPEYRSIDYQLALCTGGFGASPDARGHTVFLKNLITGEAEQWQRNNIAGTLSEERLPDWARANLEALRNSSVKEPVTAAEPLGKEQFWQLIDNARKTGGIWQNMYTPLVDSLALLEEPDIIRFKQIFDEYKNLAYKQKLWAAAAVINGGCSDDGFIDFRAWLVAQGKEVYLNALADPDSLASVETIMALGRETAGSDYMPSNGYHNAASFEAMSYAAGKAYEKKLGDDADIYTVIDGYPLSETEKAGIIADITYAADIDEKWTGSDRSWSETLVELRKRCPKLCALFHGEEPPGLAPAEPEKHGEKESVLAKIRESQKQPPQQKPKSKKQKKDGPEL